MATKKSGATKRSSSPQSAAEAYAAIQSKLDTFPEDDLVPINVDISSACALGLGAAELIKSLEADFATLPDFDHDAVAKLRIYALAAIYANAVYTDSLNDRSLRALLEQASPLREGLLVAAEALAHRNLLSASRVAEIRSGQGHHDTADDLISLAALFRASWSDLEGKTAVTEEELRQAALLGSQLHAALGAKRVGAEGRTGSQELWNTRHRAFSLFIHAYEECRRGVYYLRWHEGDADQLTPSLYRKRRRAPNEAPAETPEDTIDAPPDEPTPDLQPQEPEDPSIAPVETEPTAGIA